MRLFANLQKLKNFVKSIDLNWMDEEIESLSTQAYVCCLKWFGNPPDESRSYQIVRGPVAGTTRDMLTGDYFICIPPECDNIEQKAITISHEMYHRVTMMRKGLCNIFWVDEMMAVATSLHFVNEIGYSAYVEYYLRWHCDCSIILPPHLLPTKREYENFLLRPQSIRLPHEFESSIVILGLRLEQIVGWREMCRIAQCKTWAEWISGLSLEHKVEVCALLGLDQLYPEYPR